jgi:trimeric autotransporter adhesin
MPPVQPVQFTSKNALPANPQFGTDENSAGVTGQSNLGPGVWGQSLGLVPVEATAVQIPHPNASDGVLGEGKNGVHGKSTSGDSGDSGVLGENTTGAGVTGKSTGGDGVHGVTTSQTHAGVSGLNDSTFPCVAISGSSTNGHGVYGRNHEGAGSGWGRADAWLRGLGRV